MSANTKSQDLSNHSRWVPPYHFLTGTLVIVIVGWTLYRLVTLRTVDAQVGALIGITIASNFWYLRAFPRAVQDRLIRLEERLRLEKLRKSVKALIVNWRPDHMRA